MTTTPDVIVHTEAAAGLLSLNRPAAIHALTLPMVRLMTKALVDWRDNPAVEVVLIDHADGRGFCAGGDVAMLRQSALSDGGRAGRLFFFEEYRLNHLIATYPKPVVALMDGITMGGGVGLAGPARFRIATDRTRLAMPETGIGLFPDVGGGWYLSRLHGRLGQYLALTGARLDGAECLWAGLATHYVPSGSLAAAKSRIAADPADLATILDDLAETPPEPKLAGHVPDIARLFASDRYENILAALAVDPSEFAAATLATLRRQSPLSCKVALRQLAESLALPDFAAEMALEYRIGSRMLLVPDFAEGVRALLVDKDNAPRWQPATPEGVGGAMVDAIFAPLPADEAWTPL